MHRVLILGASSELGQALISFFSSGNVIHLVGRNSEKIDGACQKAVKYGALTAIPHVLDISKDEDNQSIDELVRYDFDIVINLAAATSRVYDSEFNVADLDAYFNADLFVPIRIISEILKKGSVDLIFVSTVLASVMSPDRVLYSSLKKLQEINLGKLANRNPRSYFLVARVGRVIPIEGESRQAYTTAKKIFDSYKSKKSSCIIGLIGWIYIVLFNLQPILFRTLVWFQRYLRNIRRRKFLG